MDLEQGELIKEMPSKEVLEAFMRGILGEQVVVIFDTEEHIFRELVTIDKQRDVKRNNTK